MIAKVKKSSAKSGKAAKVIKAAPKKTILSKPAVSPTKSSKEATKEPKKEYKSSLHRMLTAEGWKRMMMGKD